MAYNVKFTIDQRAIDKLSAPGGIVDKAVARGAGQARDRAKQIIKESGRVDTGALMQSIVSERVSSPAGTVFYQVGSSLHYAIYQHEGVEGPVVPRRAKVLRFKPSGSNVFIFRPSTGGFEGIHFLTRALEDLSANDFAA